MDLRNLKKEKGITLIALAVTIVVLLILAGVSLNAVFSQNGIISKAQDAQTKMGDAENSDKTAINNLNEEIDKWVNGNNTSKPYVTDESLTSETRTTTESSTVIAQDTLGNQVVVPGGFKIAADSGSTVKEGIVIEDAEENQFVWIPVSNINADGSNKIKVDASTEVEITLGRYIFDETNGTETLVQKGSEYAETTRDNLNTKYQIVTTGATDSFHYELSNNVNDEEDYATAKKLKNFIEQVEKYKGYFIARYEASYGEGYDSDGTTDNEKYKNAKPLSIPSNNKSLGRMEYTKGMLWTCIAQKNASIVSKNMYNENKYIESDLTNSYAWDTAIVYIEKMGNTNYANKKCKIGDDVIIINSDSEIDEMCKIANMAGNLSEWTTEYSSENNECVTLRGGFYASDSLYPAWRGNTTATNFSIYYSFRMVVYVK